MKHFLIRKTGHGREVCEDSCKITASEDGKVEFFAVSDGMGGHSAGEVASAAVVDSFEEMCKSYRHESIDGLKEFLKACVVKADSEVCEKSQTNPDYDGCGATFVCACVCNDEKKLVFVSVGDSRAYKFKDGVLTQITRDDSMAQLMREQGFTENEIKESPYRSTITKAMGFLEGAEPNIYEKNLDEADVVMVCSDGLSTYAKAETIQEILRDEINDGTCERLANSAIEAKSDDDITIILAMAD